MESQLPQPIRDALMNNEVKSGFKLLAMALSGLLGAGGVSVITYLFWGDAGAIGVGGLTLVITAFILIKALRNLDTPITAGDRMDRELLQNLVAVDRRALIVTQLDGISLAANQAFEKLNEKPVQRLQDMVANEDGRQAINAVLNTVRQAGNGAAQIEMTENDDDELTLVGKRVGHHLIWQISRQNQRVRLDREKTMVSGWAAPIFEKLECGVILEDASGHIQYANETILLWLGIEEPDAMPLKLQLKAQNTQLLVGGRQRIDVEVTDIPLSAREEGRKIGQFRFIRRLDRVRGGLASIEREFLIDPILDAAPIAIAIVDRDGGVKEYNQPLKIHPSGVRTESGSSIFDLIVEEDREALKELIEFAHDGRPASKPLDVTYSGQPERVGQVYSTSITKGDDKYAILYLVDTTQEKSLNGNSFKRRKCRLLANLPVVLPMTLTTF